MSGLFCFLPQPIPTGGLAKLEPAAQMTPDQMFVIAVLTLVIPVVTAVVTIVGGVVLFNQQSRKLDAVKTSADAAAKKSGAAETAANHSKEVVSTMQENFKAVMTVIAPQVAAALPATLPAPSNAQATPVEDAKAGGAETPPAAPSAALKVEVVNLDPVKVVETKPGGSSHKE